MSKETLESKSEGFGFHEEWESVERLGEVVVESWLLPELILGGFIADAFGGPSND